MVPSASVQEFNAAPRSYVLRSRWTCPIPSTDLCSWLFTSATFPLPRSPAIYVSIENPLKQKISLHGYRSLVQRIARGLREAGLEPGQRVMTISANNVFYPALFLGIIAAGGIFTGANPSYTPRELAAQLRNSGATFCVAGGAVVVTAVEAAGMVMGLDKRNIFIFDEGLVDDQQCWETDGINQAKQHGVRHWSEFVSPSDDFAWTVFTTAKQANTTAAINYSSGTTGVPKGVEISHWNFIANVVQTLEVMGLSSQKQILARQLGFLPMFHAFGQILYVIYFPSRNVPVYMMGTSSKNTRFDFLEYLRQISKYRITAITAVPPILVALTKLPPAVLSQIDLSCVKSVTCGGAPLGRDVRKSVESLLTKQQPPGQSVCVKQAWGMTETTCNILCRHPEDIFDDDGSVGELMPNCEAKIVDPLTGNDLPANMPGELYVRGPNVSKGYHNNPSATAAMFVDGWLRTGDAGYYNPVGKFYIVDRLKELIKVKGYQVAPAELESVLLEHSEISDAAVIGIPHAHDERPRAFIVANKNPASGGVSAEDVIGWVKQRCAPYKWITGGVVFLDEIPRNLSGKILRNVLRERARLEAGVKAKL